MSIGSAPMETAPPSDDLARFISTRLGSDDPIFKGFAVGDAGFRVNLNDSIGGYGDGG
jgi:hypothetical protein